MNIGERMYGFTVIDKKRIEVLGADAYTLTHDKCGTRLTYLDTGDDNMSFAVCFKTLPTDSTGVFHILEHSVLCGSEKYPLKDPFVELLKGSLNTFLNALTFQDKTMYPVASRNKQDFHNLVDIYMDAVLHPLVLKSPNAFYQEGWHYEVDECGELGYNGVVYNEMKGDYSSAESVGDRHINEMLYRDTPYAHDSGGDPIEIVKLDYDTFCRAHKKYYHPSLAELFLDGNVDFSDILPLLDSFLSQYERSETQKSDLVIPRVTINEPREKTAYYEVSDGEPKDNKGRVSLGFIICDFDDILTQLALMVLKRTLFGSNEARIKRRIIDSGLCENMLSGAREGIMENSLLIDFINVKDGREDELLSLFYSEIEAVINEGVDKAELLATLSFYEFQLRERDYGSCPAGVFNAISVMESLLYCDDPTATFPTSELFSKLRELVATDYPERVLQKYIFDNRRRATLYLIPSDTMREARAKEEREALYRVKCALGDEGINRLREIQENLLLWQQEPDSDEALSAIPQLSLSDISREPEITPTDIYDVEGARVISHPIGTNGISYAELYFDITDIRADELPAFSIFAAILGTVGTKRHTAKELLRITNDTLGSFGASMSILPRHEGDERVTKIYLIISASALSSKNKDMAELILEVINESVFDDCALIKKILRQTVIMAEEGISSSGHTYAMGRVRAQGSVVGTLREYLSGYENFTILKALDKNIDSELDRLTELFYSFLDRFINRGRLTISITGEYDSALAGALALGVKNGEMCDPVCNISPLPVVCEGIATPSQVSYAARGYSLLSLGTTPFGTLDVLRTLVGYEYLWGEVRVKGGAYGAGFGVTVNGDMSFYSYRDPSPERSLEVFLGTPDFLRENVRTLDIRKYVIGAIGAVEAIVTPRMRGSTASARVIKNISYEERVRNRAQLLDTSCEDILSLADLIERALSLGGICVVGPRETLSSIKGIERILEI